MIRDFCRSLVLAGLLFSAGCATGELGGREMATATSYPWKELWRGGGPAWSPTGAPPGLTIVHSKEAWTRIMKSFGPPNDQKADLSVNWTKDVILFVQAGEDSPSTEVELKSLSRADDVLTVTAELRAGSQGQTILNVEVRPWFIASVPAEAVAGDPKIRFTIGSREFPVIHER